MEQQLSSPPRTDGETAVMLERLRELVAAESPPGAIPLLTACADLLADWARR